MTTLPASSRGQLIQLAKAMGSSVFEKQMAEITKALLATILDEKQSDKQRVAAAQQLVELQAGESTKLLDTITPRSSPEFSVGILEAVAGNASSNLGAAILQRMATFTPQARAAALRILLSRPESTRQLP